MLGSRPRRVSKGLSPFLEIRLAETYRHQRGHRRSGEWGGGLKEQAENQKRAAAISLSIYAAACLHDQPLARKNGSPAKAIARSSFWGIGRSRSREAVGCSAVSKIS